VLQASEGFFATMFRSPTAIGWSVQVESTTGQSRRLGGISRPVKSNPVDAIVWRPFATYDYRASWPYISLPVKWMLRAPTSSKWCRDRLFMLPRTFLLDSFWSSVLSLDSLRAMRKRDATLLQKLVGELKRLNSTPVSSLALS
jgi:hypothetical protein